MAMLFGWQLGTMFQSMAFFTEEGHRLKHIIIAQCCASGIYMGSMLCIRHLYGLNAVQASIYCLMCIKHHNMAQNCASCACMYQYKARCTAPMTRAVHRASIRFITLNLPHHTLSTSFLSTLFAVNTWRRKEKMMKIMFCLIAGLLPWGCFRAM